MTLEVGSEFTTTKSGVVGTIREIVEHPSGVIRIRLEVNGENRWTSIRKEELALEGA
jgi:preprotein translocase subunit YajC